MIAHCSVHMLLFYLRMWTHVDKTFLTLTEKKFGKSRMVRGDLNLQVYIHFEVMVKYECSPEVTWPNGEVM